MKFNPFTEDGTKVCESFRTWEDMNPKAYDKLRTNPYTKTRVILANGTEFEGAWFKHQLLRQCKNEEIRKEISLLRRIEQEQQKEIAVLKPTNESMLEHAIAYEQLAIDLTAILAKREKDPYVKKALDFALLEDFDHLYRFANLLELEQGIKAEYLVGRYTEIMPGRSTISEHRFPYDDVRKSRDFKKADIITKLQTMIITAAEQQTMNYYMNAATLYNGELGRRLFQEIGLIEEQHVTHYGSLLDPTSTWLEEELMHEYVEAYLYYSFILSEPDECIRKIWIRNLKEEIGHLHVAARLLEKYENKSYKEVLGTDGTFPMPLVLGSNKEYIRDVLEKTVENTIHCDKYVNSETLDRDHRFFFLQQQRNNDLRSVPTHFVIEKYINMNGKDYRYEDKMSPVEELRNRRCDNVTLGRKVKGLNDRENVEFFSRETISTDGICGCQMECENDNCNKERHNHDHNGNCNDGTYCNYQNTNTSETNFKCENNYTYNTLNNNSNENYKKCKDSCNNDNGYALSEECNDLANATNTVNTQSCNFKCNNNNNLTYTLNDIIENTNKHNN